MKIDFNVQVGVSNSNCDLFFRLLNNSLYETTTQWSVLYFLLVPVQLRSIWKILTQPHKALQG